MRVLLFLFILTVATLAGCLGDSESTDSVTDEDASSVLPQLHGWVFDPAVVPIPGATVHVNAGNQSLELETDAEGFYGADGLLTDTTVIITTRAEGFLPSSKQTTLSPGNTVQMNFTMEPEPVIKPFHETLGPFQGFIQCQYTAGSDEATHNECGLGNSDNQWSIAVGKDFAGGVVELEWVENTAASSDFRVVIECATPGKCGDDTPVFADVVGSSRLRLEISNLHATKYLSDGGIMLMSAYVDPNNDANEASTGVAFAVSQEFEAIASMFYHAPPPSGYSFDG